MKALLSILIFVSVTVAGERFHKLDINGAQVFDASLNWSMVEDKTTNLIWENISFANLANTLSWSDAVARCHNLTYGLYSDWRLPNKNEISSVLDYTKANPVFDTDFFSNISSSNLVFFWASTSVDADKAWLINSLDGRLQSSLKTNSGAHVAMCVRGQ